MSRALLAALVLPLALAAVPAGAAAAAGSPTLLRVGQVTAQDVPSRGASEPDTVVEPDVAASPTDPAVAVAAAHDSRFADGGAVGISAAWTHDAGRTWHHAPVPSITTATGGPYARASDPVVAFGPDGSAYLSVLLFQSCRSAVAVLRSTDGGQTWGPPSYVHRSSTCDVSDDKNVLVVDTSAGSPHRGRLYQFWTSFRYDGTTYLGSPQVVRWSDDRGATWSASSPVTPADHGTQNSQPVVLADGTLIDTYYDEGAGGMAPDRGPELVGAPMVDAEGPIVTSRSTDGGRTWHRLAKITANGAGYAAGVRCCLFSATLDRSTQTIYAAWLGGGPGNIDPVLLSSSTDGAHWTTPVQVSRGDAAGVQRVNTDVVAAGGTVYVSYGTRTQPGHSGGYVQQQLATSTDGGGHFAAPLSLGRLSVLRYAAQAEGYFPGDYTGSALSGDRLYVVWARSSAPPASSDSAYHQVIDGAVLAR